MERVRFEYNILTVLRLTREEVDKLKKLCENHYDIAVQALAQSGPGGILNAALNIMGAGQGPVEIQLTHRQLDTLCKGTEYVPSAWIGNSEMHSKLLKMLYESNSEYVNRSPTSEIRAKLWAHCVSRHAVIIAPEASLEELEEYHKSEHEGPCTIRDHDEADRDYSMKKLGQVLSESED